MAKTTQEDPKRRWPRRRALARLVSALAYALPVGAAVGASLGLSRVLPSPGGAWIEAADWITLVVLSTSVLLVVDRLARHLLPLAALLELSLLFPDHAPRRVAVARRAGSIRNLHARIEDAKLHGVADEPALAAVRIVELVGALHAHDRRTRGHSERVRALTEVLAAELKMAPDDLDRLRWSALLHDIGKIHVSPRILNKPGQLQPDEWEAILRHPEEGARLAAPLEPWLGEWAQVIVQHHERWDGSGYPHGLGGREISYGARIVAMADAYEVMTASRSYKMPMSVAAARRELTTHAGSQFDPQVVRAFLEVSIGRLRGITGPLSWAAQVPFLGWLRHTALGAPASGGAGLGQVAGRAAAVLGTATGAVGTAVVVGALGVPTATPPASAVTVPAPPAVSGAPVRPGQAPPLQLSGAVDPPQARPQGAAPDPSPGGPVTVSSASGPPTSSTQLTAPEPEAAPVTTTTTAPGPSRADPTAEGPTTTPSPGASASSGRPVFQPPRRPRPGWVRLGFGDDTDFHGGLGQLKKAGSGG
ncbi:MAG TPA: HD domain-containing phosphohydrolase [Acidimicrobiales bacterium]|nr:HD domain-containing phosphohydrolase [Acidimicrobiales bacterium]